MFLKQLLNFVDFIFSSRLNGYLTEIVYENPPLSLSDKRKEIENLRIPQRKKFEESR